MLYGLLLVLFIFVSLLLILVILIQQGKGGLGLGYIGGGAQMLFGGSGGQDIFQKITWILGAIFIVGSFILFVMGSKETSYTRYLGRRGIPQQQTTIPIPELPKSQPLSRAKEDVPGIEKNQAPAPVKKEVKTSE